MKTAIFTGTFDPFTIGHEDIVTRALQIFDRVVIGIGYNPQKSSASDIEGRAKNIRDLYSDDSRVIVEPYSDMAADLAQRHGATCVVKGIRTINDFEYERNQAEYNRLLGEGLETVAFFARPELAAVSSTAVRTLRHFGKDVTELLPKKK
jgi:pantetheine-phosphate adenylyltransferase